MTMIAGRATHTKFKAHFSEWSEKEKKNMVQWKKDSVHHMNCAYVAMGNWRRKTLNFENYLKV